MLSSILSERAELRKVKPPVALYARTLRDPLLALGSILSHGCSCRRSEVRGQRSEVRGQRSEVRGQRSEVRGQRSEVTFIKRAEVAYAQSGQPMASAIKNAAASHHFSGFVLTRFEASGSATKGQYAVAHCTKQIHDAMTAGRRAPSRCTPGVTYGKPLG
jgi:hypothetical protein